MTNGHKEIEPPFKPGTQVKCIKESTDVWVDGKDMFNSECIKDEIYDVEYCIFSPIGWLIATPPPHKSACEEFYKAEDFTSNY